MLSPTMIASWNEPATLRRFTLGKFGEISTPSPSTLEVVGYFARQAKVVRNTEVVELTSQAGFFMAGYVEVGPTDRLYYPPHDREYTIVTINQPRLPRETAVAFTELRLL